MYEETRGEIVPLCRSNERAYETPGCPIESLATDYTITLLLAKFEQAKTLAALSQLPETQIRIFNELGLFNDPLLHTQLEFIWAKKQKAKQ